MVFFIKLFFFDIVIGNYWQVYLQKKKNSEVDEGDDDDRDQELEETGENCVPAIQHLKFGQNTSFNWVK